MEALAPNNDVDDNGSQPPQSSTPANCLVEPLRPRPPRWPWRYPAPGPERAPLLSAPINCPACRPTGTWARLRRAIPLPRVENNVTHAVPCVGGGGFEFRGRPAVLLLHGFQRIDFNSWRKVMLRWRRRGSHPSSPPGPSAATGAPPAGGRLPMDAEPRSLPHSQPWGGRHPGSSMAAGYRSVWRQSWGTDGRLAGSHPGGAPSGPTFPLGDADELAVSWARPKTLRFNTQRLPRCRAGPDR